MQAVRVSLAVLARVAEAQPVGVSALARELDLPKSTVQRHLSVLAEEGWLTPSPDPHPKWSLGPRARETLRPAPFELDLRDAALPVMHELAETLRETVYLAVPAGDVAVLIERVDSPQPVRTFNALGTQIPLHAPATGKALLAHYSQARREQVLARHSESFTSATLDLDRLRRELDAIAQRGFAQNIGEWRPDVAGIASAVLGDSRVPVCSVGISMPLSRYDAECLSDWGAALAAAALAIRDAIRRGGNRS